MASPEAGFILPTDTLNLIPHGTGGSIALSTSASPGIPSWMMPAGTTHVYLSSSVAFNFTLGLETAGSAAGMLGLPVAANTLLTLPVTTANVLRMCGTASGSAYVTPLKVG